MNVQDFLNLLNRKKQTIIAIVVAFLAVAMVFTVVQPLKYSSESRVLVVQEFAPESDPYAISKTNQYLGNLFSRVVTSHSFYEKVAHSGYDINENYFYADGPRTSKVLENWEETVQIQVLDSSSGILQIKVLHTDKDQLKQIAPAVNYVLKTENESYHGLGDSVKVKTLNDPIYSTRPAQPNILVTFLATILLALLVAGGYIYLFPGDRYNLYLWPAGIKFRNPVFFRKKKGKSEFSSTSEETTPAGSSTLEQKEEKERASVEEVEEDIAAKEERSDENAYKEEKETVRKGAEQESEEQIPFEERSEQIPAGQDSGKEEQVEEFGSMDNIFKR